MTRTAHFSSAALCENLLCDRVAFRISDKRLTLSAELRVLVPLRPSSYETVY